jgi:Ca2+-binding EF-hand superfamily protein
LHCVGYVTREQFADAYKDYFVNEINGGGYERNDKLADVIFDKYDLDHDGTIDYIEWMDSLHLCGTGSSRGLDPFLQVTFFTSILLILFLFDI